MTKSTTQQVPVAGGAYCSVPCLVFVLLPILFTGIGVSIAFGYWPVAVAIGGCLLLWVVTFLIIFFYFRNSFQLWALQRPCNPISRCFLPLVELFDSLRAGDVGVAMHTFEQWGHNFCASGQVWLGTYAGVADSLTKPQGRNHWLGEHPLYAPHLPDTRGRCVFLLSLSNKGAGGSGDHEAFRQCMLDNIFSPASHAREDDELSKKLIQTYCTDFTTMSSSEFYYDKRENNYFWMKYINHVLFGLNVEDPTVAQTLEAFFIGSQQLMYYFPVVGPLCPFGATIDKIADLYEQSPALADFKVLPEYHNMTRRELALLMVAIVRIAGVQGSSMLSWLCMSGQKHGNVPIDVREVWDKLDLSNEEEIRRYILEVARLSSPVTVSHRVATEDFSCEIKGHTYTFPKGTKVAIPFCLGSVDKNFWGPDALEFNHNRPDLEKHSLVFNSVGNEGGRICPGKELVMRTMVKLLRVVGNTRANRNQV